VPRIGIIVEGNGEVPAFKALIPKLTTAAEVLATPVRADLQPKAAPNQVAASAKAAVNYLIGRQVDMVIVLIDREDNPNAAAFAATLTTAFSDRYPGIGFEVVVKDRSVENWLVADIDALRAQPKRFKVTSAEIKRVVPNKADGQDAEWLLNKMALKFEYDKGGDPSRIAGHQDPRRAGQNSRSFRRFLRVIGDPIYAKQSRIPV
jgi:hypothetical protein